MTIRRIFVAVEQEVRHETRTGPVELEASPHHRVRVHAGPPVRGWCRAQRFVYRRGDVDIIPAGASDVWEERDAGATLVVTLAPSFLARAAADREVALAAGFAHQSHMARWMRRLLGVTPAALARRP